MALPFLPEKLDLDGSYDHLIRVLYNAFAADFFDFGIRYNGRLVVCDDRRTDTEFEEGFWHLITRGKEDRLLDYKRAKRIVWLKPLIENSDNPALHKWTETSVDNRGRGVNKTYIWYREGRYLIVLKEIPHRYFLLTAFHVTGQQKDNYYFRRFQEAQKKGPGG